MSGLALALVSCLESWLEGWLACVVISGSKSNYCVLANFVFQCTALGPPLVKFLARDARFAVRDRGFEETVFADDFNCWTIFEKDII